MKKVDVYNAEYTNLNHSYILIYNAYEKLIQCKDADKKILVTLASILRAFNPALDEIKSKMTVKTRYKEDFSSEENFSGSDDEREDTKGNKDKKDDENKNPLILHGKFGDD